MVNISEAEKNILKSLTEKPKTYYSLWKHEKVAKSNKTVLETLEKMVDKHLIIKGSVKEGKREKNPYALTFAGLIASLQFVHHQMIDIVASKHKDEWIVFQEWQDITKDPSVKESIISNILIYGRTQVLPVSREAEKFHMEMRKKFGSIYQKVDAYEKEEITLKVLGLSNIFEAKIHPSWLDNPNENNAVFKLWKTCWNNPRLKDFIEKQFEWHKYKYSELYKSVLHFEECFKNL